MIRAAIALVALLAAFWGLTVYLREEGRRELELEIMEGVKDAQTMATEAALDRRDCVDAGGVWDFAAGACRGARGDPR